MKGYGQCSHPDPAGPHCHASIGVEMSMLTLSLVHVVVAPCARADSMNGCTNFLSFTAYLERFVLLESMVVSIVPD